MISWIQRYFQHHFKAIFGVLLAVTIISFIFTIGAMPGLGGGERRVTSRKFFGYDLMLSQDQQRLFGDASLSANLQLGAYGGGMDDKQIQQYAFQRAASLHLADKWHIPQPTMADIKSAITKLPMFAGPNGQFDPAAYNRFRDNLHNAGNGVTEADILRVIADDIRINKVNQLIAGPGYVLDRDVKEQLTRTDTTWTLETATADYAAFRPAINPTPAELTKFFEDNSFRYQIPPRVVATYVDFPASEFLPKVSVTPTEVRAYYDANPAMFPKPPQPKTTGKITVKDNPAADFAAVQPKVEAALKLHRARELAIKAASDLTLDIYNAKVANNGAALDGFLTAHNLKQKALAPFTRQQGPAELGHSPEIASAAFDLDQNRFVSDALPSPDGAVVLFWKELQPAHEPLFTAVSDRVRADYIENERRKQFIELGQKAKADITAALKSGQSFDQAVAAASSRTGLKLTTAKLKPFTIRSRPQDVDYSILGALDRLNQGQVSDMIANADKGIFVYAAKKQLPNLSPSNPLYAQTRAQLASYAARIGASAYVGEVVDRELKRTEPKS